jgi:hypothetical protein
MNKYCSILLASVLLLSSCGQKDKTVKNVAENREAKAMLQGIWVDGDAATVAFKVKGDTIYYPDTTSQPAYFKIVSDTLVLGSRAAQYPVVKQSAHVFWFKNQNGDVVKLTKSSDPNDELAFVQKKDQVAMVTEAVKRDTVVMHDGERYHCYIAVNPTKYKVVTAAYNDDGVEVDNVYYDNIIHISVFHGARQLYSRDFNKKMYAQLVPASFLSQSILGNMEFERVDADGFHFSATLCVPDAASCYKVGTIISKSGKMSMELLEH